MIKIIILILGLAPFIAWIRPSFQDDKGDSSFKRLTPFLLTGLAGFMIITDKIPDRDRFASLVALLVTGAVYAGLLTAQQVYSAFIAWKGGGQSPEDKSVKIEQTQSITTINPPENESL